MRGEGFAFVFHAENSHYSSSCKIATLGVSALTKIINLAADFYFGSAAVCGELVSDTPRENWDVLPAALRNFRPYFSWINPSRVEFIFHLQAEIFILRRGEKLFNSLVLFKEL